MRPMTWRAPSGRRYLLVVHVGPQDAHAHLLAPVHVTRGQPQLGQRQHRRQVPLVVLQRRPVWPLLQIKPNN